MDKMRDFLQSWPGKLVLVGTLIPMAFLGVQGTFGGADIQPDELLKVGKQTVSVSTYQAEVNNERNALLQQGVDASLIDEKALADAVLKRLTDRALLENQASTLGMTVSDEMITQLLQQYEDFQENGQFSNDRFAAYLQGSGLTKDALFQMERLRLSLRQLINGVAGTAIYPNDQISRLLDLQLEAREVWVHRYHWQDYVDQVQISDAEIQAYFDANKDKLIKPATVDLSYIKINPLEIKIDTPTEDDIKAQYAAYLKEKGISDGRELAHILLTGDDAEKQANEIKQKLDAGESFEALAKAHSQDPSGATGGNIGSFNAAMFGDKAASVEQALNGLTAGAVSQPVQTNFGYHIFKVVKVSQDAPTIESVRDELIDRAAEHKRKAAYSDLIVKIDAMATDSMGVADIAKEVGVTAQEIIAYPQTDNKTELSQPVAIAAAFDEFTIQDQGVSPNINLGDSTVWLQPKNYQPSRPLTFDEAKEQIKTLLAKKQAIALAMKAAEEAVATAKAGGVSKLTVPAANMGISTRANPKLLSQESASLFLHQSAEGQDVWAVQTDEGASVMVGSPVDKAVESQLAPADRLRAVMVVRENVGADQLEDYLQYLRDTSEIITNEEALQANKH